MLCCRRLVFISKISRKHPSLWLRPHVQLLSPSSLLLLVLLFFFFFLGLLFLFCEWRQISSPGESCRAPLASGPRLIRLVLPAAFLSLFFGVFVYLFSHLSPLSSLPELEVSESLFHVTFRGRRSFLRRREKSIEALRRLESDESRKVLHLCLVNRLLKHWRRGPLRKLVTEWTKRATLEF